MLKIRYLVILDPRLLHAMGLFDDPHFNPEKALEQSPVHRIEPVMLDGPAGASSSFICILCGVHLLTLPGL